MSKSGRKSMTPSKRSKVKWSWQVDEDDSSIISLVDSNGTLDEEVYIRLLLLILMDKEQNLSDGVLIARVYPHGQFHPDENIDPRLVDSQLFSRACFLNPATMGQLDIKLATLIALTLDEKEYTGVAWELMVLFRTDRRENCRF